MPLTTVSLREHLTEQDHRYIVKYRNQPNVRRSFLNGASFSLEQHLRWYERKTEEPGFHTWMIDAEGYRVPVGTLSLEVAEDGASASLERVLVFPPYQGLGFGEQATGLALEWARQIGIKKVSLSTKAGNLAATKLYEKLGFRVRDYETIDTGLGKALVLHMELALILGQEEPDQGDPASE